MSMQGLAYVDGHSFSLDESERGSTKGYMKRLWFLTLVLLVSCTAPSSGTGDRILVWSVRDKFLGILTENASYVVSTDGRTDSSAVVPPDVRRNAKWSPDGKWIVFIDWELGKGTLFIMRSDGSSRKEIRLQQKDVRDPVWSPDDSQIAYTNYDTIAAHISVLTVECLLRQDICPIQARQLAEGHFPDWSPDGKHIVYEGPSNAPSSPESNYHIYMISADGTDQPRDLTPGMNDCSHARWSPDGEKIIFSCNDIVYIINPDGSGIVELTKHGSLPSWSLNGKQIAFLSTRDGLGRCLIPFGSGGCIRSNAIFLMNPDGSNVIRLTMRNDEGILEYAWFPATVKNQR